MVVSFSRPVMVVSSGQTLMVDSFSQTWLGLVQMDEGFLGDKLVSAVVGRHHSLLITPPTTTSSSNMSDSESDFEGFEPVPDSDIEVEAHDESSDEEEISTQINQQFSWSQHVSSDYHLRDFTQEVGPAHPLPATSIEIDFMNILFPPYLYEQIADETNNNAAEKQRKADRIDHRWTPVTPAEIAAYLGFNIYMGIVPKPGYKYHFSEKTDDEYTDSVGLR